MPVTLKVGSSRGGAVKVVTHKPVPQAQFKALTDELIKLRKEVQATDATAIVEAAKGKPGGLAGLDDEGKVAADLTRPAQWTVDKVAAIEASIEALASQAPQVVQGPPGEKGDQGLSAYQVARANGYGGTITQWLATLKGDTGDAGGQGPQGVQGLKGDTGLPGAPLSSSAAIGYSTGAGGAVTQTTSRTTGVSLNKASGAITLFSKTTTAGLVESFTVTNTLVGLNDTISLSVRATGNFNAFVSQVSAGSFRISVHTPVATTAEAPIINFNVIKGVAA